jgi:putative colanic acid biosynthesis UDP-glucose lipid carrier transferase
MHSGDRRIHERSWFVREAVNRLLDGCSTLAGLMLALRLTGTVVNDRHMMAGAAAVIFYYLVAEISGMYRNWRGVAADREVACALWTWGFSILGLLTLGFATGYAGGFSRRAALIWFAASPVLIAASRIAVRWAQRALRSRGFNTRGFAVVGVNELAFQLARNIENSPELGLKLIGFYDDRPEGRTPEVPGEVGRRIGNLGELVDHARSRRVDMIYITFPMRAEDRIRGILDRLGDTTASVYLVPDFFVFELLHSRWTTINGLPVVSVFENPFYGVDGLVKRCLDVCLASLFLLVAAIPMALIAAAVKLTSPGPVFFRQRRYGLDGREIMVWKFRTMRVCEDGPEVTQATPHDARVTRLGAFLRRTSLDELPQLFNVIEGNMSLVGPRPHATAHNEQYRAKIQGYMLRHKVKPGITGLAQVSGLRGETDTLTKMEQRVECDHRYIREWSLWMDVKILLRTILVVFSRNNAY